MFQVIKEKSYLVITKIVMKSKAVQIAEEVEKERWLVTFCQWQCFIIYLAWGHHPVHTESRWLLLFRAQEEAHKEWQLSHKLENLFQFFVSPG
jgi:hypothetical protein